ncbi:cytidine deaminase [bacterium]|nr:cytidine deaminase [bacterium]
MDIQNLIQQAIAARKFAIAPYSHFEVGALVVTDSGKIFTGCNIENSTYGLTVCAERVALFKALSEGETMFKYVVVVANTPTVCYPCGSCRQVISEFAPKAEIICANLQSVYETYKPQELFPHAFGPEDLKHNGG